MPIGLVMIGEGVVIWFPLIVAGQVVAGKIQFVLAQLPVANRFTPFVELL